MATKSDFVGTEIYPRHTSPKGGGMADNAKITRKAVIERMYTRILSELCANRFEWYGLDHPKLDVTARFLEMTLLTNALSVFGEFPEFDKFLALRGSPMGELNYMDEPRSFIVTGNTFINKTVKADDVVPIWANYFREPDLDIIRVYAGKLADLDRTVEINTLNARKPKVLAVSQNARLSGANIIRALNEGQDTIEVNGNFNINDAVQVLDMGIDPNALEKLHIVRTRIWSEAMGLLGIDNANQDKKERLVAAEVDANAEQVSAMKAVNLNARQQACKEIYEKFGIPIWVEFKTDPLTNPVDNETENDSEEVE